MDPETISSRLSGFDTWDDDEILQALWQGQSGAIAAVHAVLPALASAARDATNRLLIDGRLILVGAGTSGQLAALEAAEIPATFGWPQDRILSLQPGPATPEQGWPEDNVDYASELMNAVRISPADVVVAVAASGDTPFTCAAAAAAHGAGALVIALFNRSGCALGEKAHHALFLQTGAEIPAGSTRMNAGTAQKAALNLLSVLIMTRLGHVHDGLMVDLAPSNPKFRTRAIRIVAQIANCPETRAHDYLLKAGGDIKQAVLMAGGADQPSAEAALADSSGNLRRAIRAMEARKPETE